MGRRQAIAMGKADNVATAICALKQGQSVTIELEGHVWQVILRSDIPFGHKFALTCIGKGQEVIKYGEVIGLARQDILPGEYVHTHNVERSLGRAD